MAYLKQGQEALLSMFGKPPGSKPEYKGAGPNRNEFSLIRYKPAKLTPRLEKSLAALRDPNNQMRKTMIENISAGLDVGEDCTTPRSFLTGLRPVTVLMRDCGSGTNSWIS